jgi:hypothetical protein
MNNPSPARLALVILASLGAIVQLSGCAGGGAYSSGCCDGTQTIGQVCSDCTSGPVYQPPSTITCQQVDGTGLSNCF